MRFKIIKRFISIFKENLLKAMVKFEIFQFIGLSGLNIYKLHEKNFYLTLKLVISAKNQCKLVEKPRKFVSPDTYFRGFFIFLGDFALIS